MPKKNAFWDRLEDMKKELKQELGENSITEEALEKDLPPPLPEDAPAVSKVSVEAAPEGADIEKMKLEDIASKEDAHEKLLNRFDTQMDHMTLGVINLMKTIIDLAEVDPEFGPVKTRIKDTFSRGVVPYLEDADRLFTEFYPEEDPRKRRVKG